MPCSISGKLFCYINIIYLINLHVYLQPRVKHCIMPANNEQMKRIQIRCKVKDENNRACGARSSFYCSGCQSRSSSGLWGICNPSTMRSSKCYERHIVDVESNM